LLQLVDIFIRDGALVHTAYISRSLNDMQILVTVWPPYSSNLNLIVSLWALMKGIIYERYAQLEPASNTEDTLPPSDRRSKAGMACNK
jgi:hypothetical protein